MASSPWAHMGLVKSPTTSKWIRIGSTASIRAILNLPKTLKWRKRCCALIKRGGAFSKGCNCKVWQQTNLPNTKT